MRLTSNPAGARVFVGAGEVGKTPISGALLPAGKHEVIFEYGGQRKRLQVEVAAQGTNKAHATF